MNKLSVEKKVQEIAALVEGCSIRSTARLTGIAKSTILRLLADVGNACAQYQDFTIRNIKAHRVQVGEIWSFCYAKQKNVTEEISSARIAGDVWTWVALDSDSKLAISYRYAGRNENFVLVVRTPGRNPAAA